MSYGMDGWCKEIPTEKRTEKRTETHACDCISRQEAIDALDVLCQEHRYRIPGKRETYSQYNEAWQDVLDRAKGAIFNLPPAQPEQQWILCSERLPEYGVAVLTYDGYCFCVEKRIPTIRDNEGEPITGDWWVSDDYDEYDGDYYPNLRDGACIAWMPLPTPYREE